MAEGVANTNAVNVGQIRNIFTNSVAQTLHNTDQRFNQVSNALNQVEKAASRGIATSAALNGVTPYVPEKTSLNVGIAAYCGNTALGGSACRAGINVATSS